MLDYAFCSMTLGWAFRVDDESGNERYKVEGAEIGDVQPGPASS